MAYMTLFVTCLLVSAAAGNFISDIGKNIGREIADVKQPVEEVIVDVGFSQCSQVKKLFGLTYEQMEGEKEPDLNQLTLMFINSDITISYNLSRAAELIPKSPGFDPNQKLFIYVHGFTDDPTKQSGFYSIKENLFKHGQCNALALDGSSLIKWLYLRSTTYVRFMGEKLGEVLAAMTNSGVDPAQIHMIGHSLGAQISGFAGKQFTEATGYKVGRISGLDPAGPCFSNVDDDLRLRKTDADFVDVIHSDAGVFGITDAIGDVDFFPNSGHQQPECVFLPCSHSRAWHYYAESVDNPKAFPAVKCDSWDDFKAGNCSEEISYMGHNCTANVTGKYYLQTGGQSPYGLGLNGTKYENNNGVIKNIILGGKDAIGNLFG